MDREKISYFASGFLALGLVPLTAVIVPLYALGIGATPAEVGIIVAMRSLLPFLLAFRAELSRPLRCSLCRHAASVCLCSSLPGVSVYDGVFRGSASACFWCLPVVLLDRCADRYR